MKILNITVKLIEGCCFALLAVMVAVTFAQIINRSIFNGAFFWAEECAIFTMIWIAFMGSAVAIRKGSHTRIDFLIAMLPSGMKRGIEVLNYLLMATFVGILGYNSLPIIKMASRQVTVGMGVPRSVMYYSMLIGCICMGGYLVLLAVCTALNYDLNAQGDKL